jgi:hypothetical protein
MHSETGVQCMSTEYLLFHLELCDIYAKIEGPRGQDDRRYSLGNEPANIDNSLANIQILIGDLLGKGPNKTFWAIVKYSLGEPLPIAKGMEYIHTRQRA